MPLASNPCVFAESRELVEMQSSGIAVFGLEPASQVWQAC